MRVVQSILISLVAVSVAMATVPNWTYKPGSINCNATHVNPCGPSHWDRVSASCAGNSESPINIVATNVLNDLRFQGPLPQITNGPCQNWIQSIVNDAVFKVDYATAGCTNYAVTYKSQSYTLDSIELHAPSEHTIGGGYYPGEAEFIHKNAAGEIVIVSVLLQVAPILVEGVVPGNAFLGNLWSAANHNILDLNEVVVGATGAVSPYEYFTPGDSSQYYYHGSTTSPTCQDAEWFIFTTPVIISSDDWQYIIASVAAIPENILSTTGGNNRPTQALNARSVHYIPGGVAGTAAPTNAPTANPTNVFHRNEAAHSGLIIGSVALSIGGFLIIVILGLIAYVVSAYFPVRSKAAAATSAGVESSEDVNL